MLFLFHTLNTKPWTILSDRHFAPTGLMSAEDAFSIDISSLRDSASVSPNLFF